MAEPPVRIYLTGRLALEAQGTPLDARLLPGLQGRRAFAYLVIERAHPVPYAALADAVWGDDRPEAWDTALSAVVSKIRRFLGGLPHSPATVDSAFGCYALQLPRDTWVDAEAALAAVDAAEGALRRGDAQTAWTSAAVANAIARRPFLPGEEGAWIEARRSRLRDVLLRALDCLADASLRTGGGALAVALASEAISLARSGSPPTSG